MLEAFVRITWSGQFFLSNHNDQFYVGFEKKIILSIQTLECQIEKRPNFWLTTLHTV